MRTVPSANVYFRPFTSRLVNADSISCSPPNNPSDDSTSSDTRRGQSLFARASRCSLSSMLGTSMASRGASPSVDSRRDNSSRSAMIAFMR